MSNYTVSALRSALERKLSHNFGVTPQQASDEIFYKACVLVIVDIMRECRAKNRKMSKRA